MVSCLGGLFVGCSAGSSKTAAQGSKEYSSWYCCVNSLSILRKQNETFGRGQENTEIGTAECESKQQVNPVQPIPGTDALVVLVNMSEGFTTRECSCSGE